MTRAGLSFLGPYRLLNVVHNGQTTLIWQAYDDAQQRMVGIKTLGERFYKDREQIGYLRQEFAVGRTLSHPLILEIYSFDIDRGIPFLAMEWFAAANMKTRILQGVAKYAHMLPGIVQSSAEALAYLHRQGWVHRDVKPNNFLCTDAGEVKLIDFALAVKIPRGLGKLFGRRARVQGTHSYMSPEQIRGMRLDQRADVYSFGCMVFELIAGRTPFTGSSSQDLLNKHLRSSPPSLEAIDRNITPEFNQLLRRCMAKEPAKRPQNMEDFLRELRGTPIFKSTPRLPGAAAK